MSAKTSLSLYDKSSLVEPRLIFNKILYLLTRLCLQIWCVAEFVPAALVYCVYLAKKLQYPNVFWLYLLNVL